MSKRKLYVITYGDKDLLDTSWIGSPLLRKNAPEGYEKYTTTLTTEDIPEHVKKGRVHLGNKTMGITRRAAARAIRRAFINADQWGRPNREEFFRIIEIGDFKREVRAVKHWNIECNIRKTLVGGKPGKWMGYNTHHVGIPTREDAREKCAYLSEVSNYGDPLFEYKYRAVPVYVEKNDEL